MSFNILKDSFFHPMFTNIDRWFNWLCLKRVNLSYLLAFISVQIYWCIFWPQQQISTSHIAGAYWPQETAFKSKLVFIIDLIVVFNSWRVQKSVK